MRKITILIFFTACIATACDKTQGIDIAKMIFEIIGYIFTAIIGAVGGNLEGIISTEKRIEKDTTNNYRRRKK